MSLERDDSEDSFQRFEGSNDNSAFDKKVKTCRYETEER